ncbi:Oxidoreductase, partial [Globisporangium splendens]
MLKKAAGDVVVVGAGVAGCSAFYHLAKLNRFNRAFKPILVDALPPLSLTSANGSFSYRNWFPSDDEAPMRELVTQSIDELDEISKKTNNMIELNRNGYLFVTRDPKKLEEFERLGRKLGQNGGGELRVHGVGSDLSGYRFSRETIDYDLDGSDLLLGIDNIKQVFPSLKDSNAIGALHVRRCGSMNPFKLGNFELTKALEYCPGAQIVHGKVTDIFAEGGRISGLKVESEEEGTQHISTPNVVFATGPLFEETLGLLKKKDLSNFDIPIVNELHCRAVFDDINQTITSTMPLTFDSDPIGHLEFSEEERLEYAKDPATARMLKEYPSGVHVRPYLANKMMCVWTYDIEAVPAKYPVEELLDPNSFTVNGGYYCKTMDNMPLIGPAPSTVDGVFLQSAMSGVGLMSSGASGQLLAAHVMGEQPKAERLAKYAHAFLPSRFEDKQYVASLAGNRSRMGQV